LLNVIVATEVSGFSYAAGLDATEWAWMFSEGPRSSLKLAIAELNSPRAMWQGARPNPFQLDKVQC
jgi:hypothetical protein